MTRLRFEVLRLIVRELLNATMQTTDLRLEVCELFHRADFLAVSAGLSNFSYLKIFLIQLLLEFILFASSLFRQLSEGSL